MIGDPLRQDPLPFARGPAHRSPAVGDGIEPHGNPDGLLDESAGDATRESAVMALGFMSDRAALPWRSVLANGANYLAYSPTFTSSEGTGVLDMD